MKKHAQRPLTRTHQESPERGGERDNSLQYEVTPFIVVGPFPPPRHGVSAVNELLEKAALRRGFPVSRIDTAPPSLDRSLRIRWKRIGRVLRAVLGVWRFGRRYKGASVYLSLSGGAGLLYEAAIAAAARMAGASVVVHHHSYRYVDEPYWAMRLLVWATGCTATHVCLSADMGKRLRARYVGIRRVLPLSNAIFVKDESARNEIGWCGANLEERVSKSGNQEVGSSDCGPVTNDAGESAICGQGTRLHDFTDNIHENTGGDGGHRPKSDECATSARNLGSLISAHGKSRRRFRLGYLSNLSPEKGMFDVLKLGRRCETTGLPVELIVAGPFQSYDVQAEFCRLRRYLNHVNYIGPVTGHEKDEFFQSIDAFIFPTRYRNEAEPLVVLEALSWGAPVIAYARGVISKLLENGAGVAVSTKEEDFGSVAVKHIAEWINEADKLSAARIAARAQFATLCQESNVARDTLIEILAGTATISYE